MALVTINIIFFKHKIILYLRNTEKYCINNAAKMWKLKVTY